MATCKRCGCDLGELRSVCPECGSRDIDDRWAPPGDREVLHSSSPAPFGYSASGAPRRISLLSKLALGLAVSVPPVGLVVAIVATAASRRHRNRPGNRAMAIASIFASLHFGLIWGYMAFLFAVGASTAEPLDGSPPYGDPLTGDPVFTEPVYDTDPIDAEANAELQKLLDELLEQAPDAGAP